ncbi:MAG TPA: hypothetical protein VKX49_04315 [Bryobacteraceae bacterium]|nr:hypothetical protein [Bryobacteraceae bacterium]
MKNTPVEFPKPEVTEAPKEPGYTLTSGERAVLAQYNQGVANAKVRIHDLNVELQKAQEAMREAQHGFTGIVTLLAQTHGMQNATLTPDWSRIVPLTQ